MSAALPADFNSELFPCVECFELA
uniref:Uncharacterized protein n=1 Tax=Anguilla anguilla TaxID=7936 RepID=A0A0E9RC68_ANGAN